ncbi:ABC-type transport system, involved in lipoprotein release, permease component [Chitinophaga rupis]|uniref:ABC-type transport system, involved in lipoprotein release, permease component n=1 Tax=Chitinophaga rupis TaxID=573321 RepID=A0A1H7UHU9_9BACT|nr:ABC transporter permease [Chitinophaga rupis]SEL96324.1 ABC-type transport system, involved in lipoprotein release, permease component [Chitinophaga rupis]
MSKIYFKLIWRNLVKDRQFSFLNLLGLSTGLACAVLIYLWVNDELQVDNFHEKDSRLYQVMQNVPLADGGIMTTEHTPDLLAEALKEEVPGIEDVAMTQSPDETENPKGLLSVSNTGIKARGLFVTGNFFNIFSYHLIEGNKEQAFSNKSDVLLSKDIAIKLFHDFRNITGKTITWYRGKGDPVNGTYMVSGIFEAPPSNSTLQFDILFSHPLYVATTRQDINWYSSDPSTYVVLKKGIDPQQVDKKIKDFIRSKNGAESDGTLFLQHYSGKYLYNHYENGKVSGGRIEYVKLFSIIAFFILIIACINFMNLSTAKASQRLKEVGIKKVVGASRRSLILQYLGESALMALLSLVIALLLVIISLPAFKGITGKDLTLHFDASFILSLTGITLATGFIAGSYPALYLSGFKPLRVLKGGSNTAAGESWIRKGLVVFQFTISVVLIVSVLVVYWQMKLIQTKNLGYNKDNIIRITNEGKIQEDLSSFLSELKNTPGVINASDVEGDMLGNHSGGGGIDWPGKTGRIEFSGLYVDYDLMETIGLSMKEGRMFSRKISSDSTGVIFNETAIAAMKLKNPVGQTVKLWGNEKHIIGVVKDFHFESLHKKLGPFFLSYQTGAGNILVKVKAGAEKETLTRIGRVYNKFNPGLPFEYSTLNNDYHVLYASEERVAILSRYFAGIAIVISCLGLFGLVAFSAQKRQKEIGIRKVIGASVLNIATMLSADFFKLVLLAFLIAIPISWWAADQWLQNFAYHITINGVLFIVTGASIILITLLTVIFQTIKAAIANPVNSLRAE